MNVSLTPKLDQFVADQVEQGRYRSSSEVVREGLRLLEAHEAKLQNLQQQVEEGRQSGYNDGKSAMQRLRKKLKKEHSV
jgi:antitoxin ParD1/3/4